MAKNLLLEYSEELATKCELLCKSISGNSNTVFQLRKSSASVFANISEAQYPQSLADMLSLQDVSNKEIIVKLAAEGAKMKIDVTRAY